MKHWSRAYRHCRRCLTKEKPCKGNGLCTTCYDKEYRRKNLEKRRAMDKERRLRIDRSAEIKAWKDRNPDRVRQHNLTRKAKSHKWTKGARVSVLFAGHWCEGVILGRVTRMCVAVQLKGGTVAEYGLSKNKKIRMMEEK